MDISKPRMTQKKTSQSAHVSTAAGYGISSSTRKTMINPDWWKAAENRRSEPGYRISVAGGSGAGGSSGREC